jgi:hypothetical protein
MAFCVFAGQRHVTGLGGRGDRCFGELLKPKRYFATKMGSVDTCLKGIWGRREQKQTASDEGGCHRVA